jgi:hypothetical protein
VITRVLSSELGGLGREHATLDGAYAAICKVIQAEGNSKIMRWPVAGNAIIAAALNNGHAWSATVQNRNFYCSLDPLTTV